VRRRLALKVGSEKGLLEAKSRSSHGRSNFISVIVSRQGKFEKNENAQSRRVIMFINLMEMSISKEYSSFCK
jgi:hypothetical protein